MDALAQLGCVPEMCTPGGIDGRDQRQPGFPADVLPNYLQKLGVEYHIETEDTYSTVQREISLSLFNLRFWLKIWRPDKPLNVWLRYIPHINDTLLLFTGMMLMAITAASPFGNARWLAYKLLLVVVYVVLGFVCTKNPPRSLKSNLAYVAATATVLVIIWLAHCKLANGCSLFAGWYWHWK